VRELVMCAGAPAVAVCLATLLPSVPGDRATLLRAGIAGAALAAVVVAARIGGRTPRAAVALLFAAALFDAGSLGFNYATKEGRTRRVEDLVAASAADGAPVDERLVGADAPFFRVAAHHRASGDPWPARAITSDAEFNWEERGAAAGVGNVRGLASLVPLRTLDLARIVERGAPFPRVPPKEPLYAYGPTRSLGSPLIDLYAVRYAIGYPEQPGPGWRRIGPGEWERDAVPQARLVEHVVTVPPDGEAWRELVRPGFDPRTTAVVESARALPDGGGPPGTVTIARLGPDRLRLDIDARRAAVLVWAEAFDPGWRLEIDGPDGAPAAVLRADHAFMAAEIPPGRHVAEFTYVAPGWVSGVTVSACALVVLAGLAFVAVRRASGSIEPA